jgi:hypothetical protein
MLYSYTWWHDSHALSIVNPSLRWQLRNRSRLDHFTVRSINLPDWEWEWRGLPLDLKRPKQTGVPLILMWLSPPRPWADKIVLAQKRLFTWLVGPSTCVSQSCHTLGLSSFFQSPYDQSILAWFMFCSLAEENA